LATGFSTSAAVAIRLRMRRTSRRIFPDDSENELAAQADQGRGRFRSLLLKSVRIFFTMSRHKSNAQAGRTVQFVSWDAWMAEAPSQVSISHERSTRLHPSGFRSSLGCNSCGAALRRLREECEGKGVLAF
jgi:hypothetical protein